MTSGTSSSNSPPFVRPPVRIVPKGWGHELWIHNDERYCGKLLFVKAGKRCSLHFHGKKYETFFVQSGSVRMRLRRKDGREETFDMKKGDCLEIPQGTAHQFTGIEDCELFEFSTQHFDEDSHRIEKGD